jgi:hypothetical protein
LIGLCSETRINFARCYPQAESQELDLAGMPFILIAESGRHPEYAETLIPRALLAL